jgi:hypothetical protein
MDLTPLSTAEDLAAIVDKAADSLDTPMPLSYSTIRAVLADAVQAAYNLGKNGGKP